MARHRLGRWGRVVDAVKAWFGFPTSGLVRTVSLTADPTPLTGPVGPRGAKGDQGAPGYLFINHPDADRIELYDSRSRLLWTARLEQNS